MFSTSSSKTVNICLERERDGRAFYGWVDTLEFPTAILRTSQGLYSEPGDRFILTLKQGVQQQRYYAVLQKTEIQPADGINNVVAYSFEAPRHFFGLENFSLQTGDHNPIQLTMTLKRQGQDSEEFTLLECSRTTLTALCPFPITTGTVSLVELRNGEEAPILCQAEIDESAKIPELNGLFRVGFRIESIEQPIYRDGFTGSLQHNLKQLNNYFPIY
jgi:hypothetical protein